jgi:hypothetical protein
MAKRSQQDKTLLGLSGEFAVASHLCLCGYVASLTLKNYPGVDIFAFNPKNKRNVSIQVKTKLGGRRYFLPKDISETGPAFVFVLFETKEYPPQFFVVPSKEVVEISKREARGFKKPPEEQPRMISITGIREFKDQWQNLGLD